MIGLIIAAHGELADALVDTATMVVQSPGPLSAISVTKEDNAASVERKLRDAIQEFNGVDGVLVLTDMFGGTPSQVSMTLHATGKVEILTGANLPMLIKAIQIAPQESDLDAAAHRVRMSGERAIVIASDLLSK